MGGVKGFVVGRVGRGQQVLEPADVVPADGDGGTEAVFGEGGES